MDLTGQHVYRLTSLALHFDRNRDINGVGGLLACDIGFLFGYCGTAASKFIEVEVYWCVTVLVRESEVFLQVYR